MAEPEDRDNEKSEVDDEWLSSDDDEKGETDDEWLPSDDDEDYLSDEDTEDSYVGEGADDGDSDGFEQVQTTIFIISQALILSPVSRASSSSSSSTNL